MKLRVTVIHGVEANRVVRGGSWNNPARNLRAANRDRIHPSNRNDNLGFRLARARSKEMCPRLGPIVIPSRIRNGASKNPDPRCVATFRTEREGSPTGLFFETEHSRS
jgi:hypothetical protein